jgi:putative DNA methylase
MGGNTLVRWNPVGEKAQHVFGRQALPMIWDFAEPNLLGDATGSLSSGYEMVVNGLLFSNDTFGEISNADASSNFIKPRPAVISTDPPYYDNVGYADLSDFFYVWLKPSLSLVWPDLFRRLTTPKTEELVATPHRHGGKGMAEAFFMKGMSAALRSIQSASTDDAPVSIYYAFKQAEMAVEGVTSAGWSTFLQAVTDAGLSIDGTWPLRTEMATRMRGQGSNALASSVVLICRKREGGAAVITRADFIRALKREMPAAIDAIRKAGVGPVDMQQSVIGPGMGVFSRHAKVLEDDDSAMSVKTALALINRVWEEIENELDSAFDAETQVALAWFATYGFDARASGELITLANAKNTPSNGLFVSGVFKDLRGKAALTPRDELPADWSPATDRTLTVWECVQHTARVLNAPDGGGEAAAALVAQMGPRAEEARALAYRLFEIATSKGWASEALVYNELAQEWTKLEDIATTLDRGGRAPGPNQAAFAF